MKTQEQPTRPSSNGFHIVSRTYPAATTNPGKSQNRPGAGLGRIRQVKYTGITTRLTDTTGYRLSLCLRELQVGRCTHTNTLQAN